MPSVPGHSPPKEEEEEGPKAFPKGKKALRQERGRRAGRIVGALAPVERSPANEVRFSGTLNQSAITFALIRQVWILFVLRLKVCAQSCAAGRLAGGCLAAFKLSLGQGVPDTGEAASGLRMLRQFAVVRLSREVLYVVCRFFRMVHLKLFSIS